MSTKTVKLAIYQDLSYEYGSPSIFEFTDWIESEDSGYTRLSKPIEVDFEMILDEHDIILGKVEALRKKKAVFNAKIDEQISKLMALPNPEDFGVVEEDFNRVDEEAVDLSDSSAGA